MCFHSKDFRLFVSVLQYSEGFTQFFEAEKKMTVWIELASKYVVVMPTSITHVFIVQSF